MQYALTVLFWVVFWFSVRSIYTTCKSRRDVLEVFLVVLFSVFGLLVFGYRLVTQSVHPTGRPPVYPAFCLRS